MRTLITGFFLASLFSLSACFTINPNANTGTQSYQVLRQATPEEIWSALTPYLREHPEDRAAVDLVMNSSGLQNEVVRFGGDADKFKARKAADGAANVAANGTIFLGLPGWPITISIGPGGEITIGFGPPSDFNPVRPPVLPPDPAPPLPPPPPIVAPPVMPGGNQCGSGSLQINPDGGPSTCRCPGTGPNGAVWVNQDNGQSSCGNSPYNGCYGVPGVSVSGCVACVNTQCPYGPLGYPSGCAPGAAACAAVP